jgi:hypothetical protein
VSAIHHDPEYIRNARIVRRIITAQLQAGSLVICVNCGRAIQQGQRFDVGHKRRPDDGGSHALSNLGGAHRRCNRSHGGRIGAAMTNRASRRARRLPSW